MKARIEYEHLMLYKDLLPFMKDKNYNKKPLFHWLCKWNQRRQQSSDAYKPKFPKYKFVRISSCLG